MNSSLLVIAFLAVLSLSACEKPTVVNAPAIPGPAGPAGDSGAQGDKGKSGDGDIVIVVPPADPPPETTPEVK